MDWDNPMAMFGYSGDAPPPNDNEVDDDDMEDFYGDDSRETVDAQPGALESSGHVVQKEPKAPPVQAPPTPTPQLSAEARAENQRKAQALRAKLLAKRQNTPQAISRTSTPARPAQHPETPSKTPAPTAQPPTKPHIQEGKNGATAPASDVTGLEALLAQGKAMADAKIAALAANAATAPAAAWPAAANGTSKQHKNNNTEQEANGATEPARHSTEPAARPFNQSASEPVKTPAEPVEQPRHITNLSDAYYADLPAWLELTGYHDVDYRNAKLRTYKERRALEEEAARIAAKLEKLRQEEQDTMQQMRMGTPKVTSNMAPPLLPAAMPVEQAAAHVNGTKRAHSPAPPSVEKSRRREDGGFRIRGANDSPPDARPSLARGANSPGSSGLERRISYPELRRRSIDERDERGRDPSLERRQSYYHRDGDSARYDHYTPREPLPPREPPPRHGYSNPNSRSNSYARPPLQYRGSTGLDLRKGGVKYFMIKSWNLENVIAAQHESLWATQEKNQELLTEAFNNNRHVILLFSVNKSMAFQGYALMTSPPDPKLPIPGFCTKLNWKTSPAFTLRWLSTTPIHFRLIGHLKNTLNLDEKGEPRAVLVGKDGQEISADAGLGVVRVLDEVEGVVVEKDAA